MDKEDKGGLISTELKDSGILFPKDIACIDYTVASGKLGSEQAATLITAAGELAMQGVSVEDMIRRITPYAITVRDRRIMETNRQAHNKKINELRGAYQVAIDKFANEMARIDHAANTYAKIRYEDERIRPLRMHGELTKPNRYSREIEIDEIILSGTDNYISKQDKQ